MNYDKIKLLCDKITCTLFGVNFKIKIGRDNYQKYDRMGYEINQSPEGRVFVQLIFNAPCSVSGEIQEHKCRKWYLSDFMTADEVIKTCYAAFEMAVKHEVMESFKVNGKILFNPHINYESLLAISDQEVRRT